MLGMMTGMSMRGNSVWKINGFLLAVGKGLLYAAYFWRLEIGYGSVSEYLENQIPLLFAITWTRCFRIPDSLNFYRICHFYTLQLSLD